MNSTSTKREIAEAILREIFANRSRVAITEIVAEGEKADVSRRTLTRAAKTLGIHTIYNGPYDAFWELPRK